MSVPQEFVDAINRGQKSDEAFIKELDRIEQYLHQAMQASAGLMQYVLDCEDDSELHRKLHSYLVPNLHHWIYGAQAGSIRDLRECFARRAQPAKADSEPSGIGQEVLTKSKKKKKK